MSLKKTSFPKQDIRVLLLEGVSQTAVDTLRAAGYSQIEYHAKALPEDELKATHRRGAHRRHPLAHPADRRGAGRGASA